MAELAVFTPCDWPGRDIDNSDMVGYLDVRDIYEFKDDQYFILECETEAATLTASPPSCSLVETDNNSEEVRKSLYLFFWYHNDIKE